MSLVVNGSLVSFVMVGEVMHFHILFMLLAESIDVCVGTHWNSLLVLQLFKELLKVVSSTHVGVLET